MTLTPLAPAQEDEYRTLDDCSDALRKAGLESSNLIVGIDYTKSNEYTGKRSFGGKSLHFIGYNSPPNPYQKVLEVMGRTLGTRAIVLLFHS